MVQNNVREKKIKELKRKISSLILHDFDRFSNVMFEIDYKIKEINSTSNIIEIIYIKNFPIEKKYKLFGIHEMKIVKINLDRFTTNLIDPKRRTIKFELFIKKKLKQLSNGELEKLWFKMM